MLTIYHNPRCSKSRQTLALIEEANAEVKVVEYLKTPLTKASIQSLQQQLNVPIIEMMRTKEEEFKQQNLKTANEQALLEALVATPKLLERPIVTNGKQAIIGRPPENVLTLINTLN